MPQMFHDVVQGALIVEEEMINGGQGRTPVQDRRDMRHLVCNNIRHQLDIHLGIGDT
jgi:hypothetical protein